MNTQDNKLELLENGTDVALAAVPDENTPEMPTQFNKHELVAGVAVAASPLENTSEMPTQFNKHELSATYSPVSPGAVGSYGSISPDQFELASDPIIPELEAREQKPLKRKPLPPQSPILQSSSIANADSIAQGSANSGEGRATSPEVAGGSSRLDILQQRMERVRAEKERLAKVQELEEMEATLQEEIMAELRKEHGLRDSI